MFTPGWWKSLRQNIPDPQEPAEYADRLPRQELLCPMLSHSPHHCPGARLGNLEQREDDVCMLVSTRPAGTAMSLVREPCPVFVPHDEQERLFPHWLQNLQPPTRRGLMETRLFYEERAFEEFQPEVGTAPVLLLSPLLQALFLGLENYAFWRDPRRYLLAFTRS